MRSGGYGLDFINSRNLYTATEKLVTRIEAATAEANPYKNVVDPFGALFDAGLVVGLNSSEWLGVERSRQIGKSLSNAVGDFHQELIGYLPGWESTGLNGGVVDLIHTGTFGSRETPVIAELKNKHNTMNSSSAEALHNRFQEALKWPNYKDYTAYLIEVIPKKPGGSDEPWAPAKRGKVDRIRKIDAASIYRISSGGDYRALEKLFDVLPLVLMDIKGENSDLLVIQQDAGFKKLFTRAI